ncbi:MAG: sigma-70 family RNA polymerase sigma factor [Clostridia bacterium]|nr:sigma-70 family RNA polymerase sigma factor [Clostridia bacterium]
MDDRTIVELYLARSEAAIAETSAKYGARLKKLAFNLLRDEQAAEECEADAYLAAWNGIPPAEPCDHLFAFLGRIVRCRAIDRLQAQTAKKRSARLSELTREVEECIPSPANVEAEAEGRELARLINAFLEELPREKRDVFVRRYWYMDSVADLARLTGSSEGRVKMMLMRLREKLREHLEKNGYNA